MGKRGPRKEPAELKVAKGTFRGDRDGAKPAEFPAARLSASVEPPESLGDHGRAAWADRLRLLEAGGVVHETDRSALETYCRTFDEVAALDEIIGTKGGFFTTPKGFVCQHPAVGQRFKWLDLRRRYEAEFGLTPSARTTVRPSKATTNTVIKRQRA